MYYIRLYSYIVLSVFTLHIVSYFLVILYDYFASVEMFLIAYTVIIAKVRKVRENSTSILYNALF